MSNELLTAAFLVWLAASLISLTGRGLVACARTFVFWQRRRNHCRNFGAAQRHGSSNVADPARRGGRLLSVDTRRLMVVGVRIGSCGISLRVSDAGTAGPSRLAVWRRHEPDRSARCVRNPRRRGVSHCVGNHELRRCRNDPQRKAVVGRRSTSALHAWSSGGWRDCTRGRGPAAGGRRSLLCFRGVRRSRRPSCGCRCWRPSVSCS